MTTKPVVDLLASKWGVRTLFTVALLGLWQYTGSDPSSLTLAPFSEVVEEMVIALTDVRVLGMIAGTLQTAAVGYVIAAMLGVSIGLATGSSLVARNAFDPIINALYIAPISSLIPVIGIWIGLQFSGKVFLVVMFAIFVIIINTSAGVRDVDPNLTETARSFGAGRRRFAMARHVILPAAAPHIATGLRLAVGRAIRGAILADILLAVANLGQFILTAGSTFQIARLLAAILITTLIGFTAMQAARRVEQWVLPWRPVQDTH